MIRKVSYKAKAELPYNPDDVNISLRHFRVGELIGMIDKEVLEEIFSEGVLELDEDRIHQMNLFEESELDISGDDGLQRNVDLWNNVQKSLFIESLMIKLPIPIFYLDGSQKNWRVVDGLQRLHSIISFIDKSNPSHFRLKGLEYMSTKCDGKYFDELPGYLQARIMDAELEAYVINPGTPPEVKYNIFKRINTGGLKLTGQEIRNAFCRGVPADFTKKLAAEEAFQTLTEKKISPRRMEDREYATRFIAFQIFDYKEYISKMDVFLTEAMMELYERDKSELKELRTSFITTCERVHEILGEGSLLRINRDGQWMKRPNKALFDTLSWNFNSLSEREFEKIKKRQTIFQEDYEEFMMNDELLYKSISDTTGSKTSVINRFERMNYFIKNFVQ